MIEVTDEMVEVFYLAGQNGPDVKGGLAAVLAIVERDYCVVPRDGNRPDVGLCCIGYAPCERRPGCDAAEINARSLR